MKSGIMKSGIGSALLLAVMLLTLTACGNAGGSGGTSLSTEDKAETGETSSMALSSEKETAGSIAESLASEDGLAFQKTASRAATAFLRNDKEKLSQYMSDPNDETIVTENGRNLMSDLEYMVMKIPSSFDISSDNDGVYPITYEYVINGTDMVMYLDMGLRSTDGVWKVEYIDSQG